MSRLVGNIYSAGRFVYLKSIVCFQWKKAEEKLERELLEAEASESKEKKLKLVSNLEMIFPFLRSSNS